MIVANRYKIKKQIGLGSQSYVYLCDDISGQRVVALKELIFPSAASGEKRKRLAERFRRGAIATAKLKHRNIVQFIDYVESDSKAYLVTDYVDGRTLKDIISLGKIPLARAMNWMLQILDTLQYAHDNGIVHRDLKPANIVLDGHIPKLIDFGIAKIVDITGITMAGASLGTPAYMSPEQINAQRVHNGSDIFSLGIIFYECITGRHPFENCFEIDEMMDHIIHKPINFPSGIPNEIKLIIEKATQKNTGDRYQSAREMADELNKAIKNLAQKEPEEVSSNKKNNIDSLQLKSQPSKEPAVYSISKSLADDELKQSNLPLVVFGIGAALFIVNNGLGIFVIIIGLFLMLMPAKAGTYEKDENLHVNQNVKIAGDNAIKNEIRIRYLMDGIMQEKVFNKKKITVGRGSDNDLAIHNDKKVSSHHIQILVNNGQTILEDVGSLNKTFVNGKQITHGTVKSGDEIRMGDTKLFIET